MPRPFHFSLQKVLDYRSQLEEQARMALAQAQAAYAEQVRRTESLRKRLAEHERNLYHDNQVNADELWLWRNYRQRLLDELRSAEARMLELAKEVNRRRREAVERSKDKKLLEKLKTQQALRHEQEEQYQEQKAFDETATLRYQSRDV
jgi:flagellar FliJ protein